MSQTNIPQKVKLKLWLAAGGRCEYRGCNIPLWQDSLDLKDMNKSYLAHIVADTPGGPRGDPIFSPQLAKDVSNIMLLCDEHHRKIDREQVAEHPVVLLQGMKKEHEERIELLTSISPLSKTHVVLYGANIGENPASDLSWERASEAIVNERKYPANKPSISIGMYHSAFTEKDEAYWKHERESLQIRIRELKQRLSLGGIKQISLFGLAPQPLLIDLGRHLSDIADVDVYQLHREPKTWSWLQDEKNTDYSVEKPESIHQNIALNLSLSGTIMNSRIYEVMGKDISIWTLTIPEPNNDFLKSKQQLGRFREVLRTLFDEIKRTHGQDAILNVFPATPVAIAIEVGRVWMPKADLKLRLYDEIREQGFVEVFDIV